MARLKKADLEQMDETYFKSLEPERLVEVAKNLYELAVEQLEKLEQNSQNSSRPPSTDSPDQSSTGKLTEAQVQTLQEDESSVETAATGEGKAKESTLQPVKGFGKRKAGKQPGAKGKWREQPLKAEKTIDHVADKCAACNASLDLSHRDDKPHLG
jgi:transposase